jgi:hypothetical protein
MEPATRVALKTVLDEVPRLSFVKHIRFVLFSTADEQVYVEVLAECSDRAFKP